MNVAFSNERIKTVREKEPTRMDTSSCAFITKQAPPTIYQPSATIAPRHYYPLQAIPSKPHLAPQESSH
jgi:hypothetical protein